jgi:competence protein ComEC
MAAALTAFVAGVLLLQQCGSLPSAAWLAAIAGGVAASMAAAVALRRRSAARRRVLVCLAATLAGFGYAAAVAQMRLSDQLDFGDEGSDVELTGVVAALPAWSEQGVRFAFDVQSVEPPEIHVPEHIALTWYQPPEFPRPAEQWRFKARLRRPHGNFNPGGFDAELWMLEQGVRATGYVRDGKADIAPARLRDTVWRLSPLIDRARDRLRERLEQALAQRRYGGVIIALVMGDQGLIEQADWTLFNRTGISHLVSISGLHITMIAAMVALAAGALWRRSGRLLQRWPVPSVRAVAGTAGALGYCLLAGWGVPAQRTFVMLATIAAALMLRLRPPAFTVLAAAAAVVCLWDPWAVTAPGFWLSFGAVACIFLCMHGRLAPPQPVDRGQEPEPGHRASRWLRRVAHGVGHSMREAARVQAAVTIGLVPLTLALFQQISPVSPLANAIAIPLVSYAVTPLALLGAAMGSLGGPLQAPGLALLLLSHALFEHLARVLAWMVQLPYAWVAFAAPPIWAVALAGVAIAWLLAPAGWPLRWVAGAWLLPALAWPPDRPAPGALWVTALDVGQGMALVLETARTTLVFDTGPRQGADVDAGARVIIPYLRSRGIDRLGLLVISHLDADHSGGAISLLDSVQVERVLTSVAPAHELLRSARGVQRCEQGQQLRVGDLALTVLSPPASLYELPRATTNARSCVVQARIGASRVLLTGDVPARQEAAMVAAYGAALSSQLMVAPHHGSRSSSSEALIQAVRPTWASVQAGYRSRFGHPHPLVLWRYRQAGVRVVRSDWSGAARWRFDVDGSSTLEQWRLDHGRYWLNQPSKREQDSDPPAAPEGGAGATVD